jgi:Regulator of chromosome condensation (RCC1) repeat
LRQDGVALCWGQGQEAGAPSSDERFVAIAAGSGISCGLRADGSLRCWGDNCAPEGCTGELVGRFSAIDAGDGVCGLETNGQISCATPRAPPLTLPGSFVSLASGWGVAGDGPFEVCGFSQAGALTCAKGTMFAGEGYQGVSAALGVVVAMDEHGALTTAGFDPALLGALPEGSFRDVDLGSDYALTPWGCAITTGGRIQCFGHPASNVLTPPETPD